MTDVLDLYNSLNETADKAIEKTATLIKHSQILANIKPIGATLFHGALGPGLYAYDPFSQFVKGEASFAKATKDFVVDAKQFEFGGKIAAKSIETIGNATIQNSAKLMQGTQTFSRTVREWTSASKMMEDTITSLAGKTGIMARSFTGLAQVIKVATGPIATAILATSLVYSQFVEKWMADSERLEARLRTTMGMFKGGEYTGLVRGMERWTGQGGSRQEFLGLLGQTGVYGQRVGQTGAMDIAALARVISIQTGKSQAEQFDKLMEHFYTRTLRGVSPEAMEAERLRMRVVAGGPGAGLSLRSPLDRYSEWSQNVGGVLNRASRGWSGSEIYRNAMFSMPGDILGRTRARGIGAANWVMEHPYLIPGAAALAIPSAVGGLVGRGAGALERGAAWWDESSSLHNLDVARRLAVSPLESERERGRRLGLQGAISGVSGLRRRLDLALTPGQKALAGEEADIERRRQVAAAYEMSQEGKTLMPQATEKISALVAQGYGALGTGKAEDLEKVQKGFEGLEKELGKSMQQIVDMAQTHDQWVHTQGEVGGDLEKYKAKIVEDQKKVDERKKALEAIQKLSTAIIGKDVLPAAGTLSFQQISGAPYGQLEQEEIAFRKSQVATRIQIQQLEAKERLDEKQKEQLRILRQQAAQQQYQETGFSAADYEALQKAQAAGDIKEVERLSRKQSLTQVMQRRGVMQQAEGSLMLEHRESGLRIANIELPSALRMYEARGIITPAKRSEIEGIRGEQATYGTVEAQRAQMQLQEAAAAHQARLQQIETIYAPRQRALQGQGIGASTGALIAGGMINEKDVTRIQELIKKGDEVSLHHAERILQLTQQRAQIEEQILQTKIQVVQREGSMTGIGLELASQTRRGIKGPESETMAGIAGGGDVRLQDATQGTMRSILSIREKMYQEEIAYTQKYAAAKMDIIRTHYDNLNALEKGKLEQLDRQFAAHQQYGQNVFGLQNTQVQAQMGRYAGEDYWRQQYRGERGLAEQGTDILLGASGMQIPRELQIARALRGHRENVADFRRQQARQMEEDQAGIQGAQNTENAIAGQLPPGTDMGRFYSSEGGRKLLMGMLQQNQAAYSRQGIDVSGQIRGLAQQQQVFEGRKLAVTQNIQGRETKSLEEQVAAGEAEIEGGTLKTQDQKDRARLGLAEKYKQLSQQYLATGQVDKAEEASRKQEEIMGKLPDMLKKDFGDTAKQQLNELQTQTKVLNAINEVLGGKTPGEEGVGIKSEEGKDAEGKKGGLAGTLTAAGDKMLAAAERLEKIRVDVNVQGGGATATVSSGGGAGQYGPG